MKVKKLASIFPVKDTINFQHKNKVVYYEKCPNPNGKDDYIGKTDRRVIKRVINHNKRGKKSHILKYLRDKWHTHVWEGDFELLDKNYQILNRKLVSLYT